jgi:ribulose kinase
VAPEPVASGGLADVLEEDYRRVGTHVRALGEPVGQGLSMRAASELGLRPGTPVSASIIDAHAGGLGVLGMDLGGGLKNEVFLREHADVTGCTLVLPREPEAVLLGAALLGAVAARAYPDIITAMKAMAGAGRQLTPDAGAVRAYHDRKYRVYHRMHDDQLRYNDLMRA